MRNTPLRLVALAIIAGVVVITVVGAYTLLSRHEAGMASVRLVDDHPLYTASFDGNTNCVSQVSERRQSLAFACTLFAAYGNGDRALAGRNFDWSHSPALLLFTHPPDGYASVSMIDVAYLGISADTTLAAAQLERLLGRASALPFDGMNEQGLFVGMAAVPDSEPSRDPTKPTVDSLCAIRLMLDHAKNTAEATDLLGKYNIDFGGGPQIHYLLADAAGHSAVVEYRDGAMSVVPGEQPWQVATNFYLTHSSQTDQQGCWRYSTVSDMLSEARGIISPQQGMGLLSQAAQTTGDYPTQWSALYNLRSGDVTIAVSRHYTNTHTFKLSMQ